MRHLFLLSRVNVEEHACFPVCRFFVCAGVRVIFIHWMFKEGGVQGMRDQEVRKLSDVFT